MTRSLRPYRNHYDDGGHYHSNADLSIFYDEQTGELDEKMMDTWLAFEGKFIHETKIKNNKKYGLQNDKVGIYQHIQIIDLKNAYIPKFFKERKVFEYLIKKGSKVYPEYLRRMYIINSPYMFRIVWNILKRFVHPVTASKTCILGSDYIGKLTEEIDIHMIPEKYGGEGKWKIRYGGAPEGFYEETS